MNVVELLLVLLIPLIALIWTIRFKSYLAFLAIPPVLILVIAALALNADPTITFINSTSEILSVSTVPGNSTLENIFSYDVTSSTGQVLINAISSQTQAELPSSSSSQLFGDEIDCITVWLGKSGSPPESTITFGVFDTSNVLIKSFGTQTVASMTSSALTPYTHCLPSGETHILGVSHYVGVNYNAGDATNTLTMRVDGNNPFDGTTTYRSQYIVSWSASTGQDIMAQFYLRDGVSSTATHTYVQQDTETTYTISPEVMLILNTMFMTGFLMVTLVVVKRGVEWLRPDKE